MAFVDAAKGCENGVLVGRGGESSEYGTRPGLDGGDESTGPKTGDDDMRYIGVDLQEVV